ncbi:MAG TPA: hypothetical protein VF043_04040 [Ktedonobacteraceae bacterium]
MPPVHEFVDARQRTGRRLTVEMLAEQEASLTSIDLLPCHT